VRYYSHSDKRVISNVLSMIEKLIKIQKELKVPKDQRNSFGNYNYRSCEDIVEAAKPLCHAEGLSLVISDEMVEVGGRVYVKATAQLHDGTTDAKATGWAREAVTKKGMDEAQITGSASSYARKYALNGLFAIDDTKDADTDEQHTQAKNAPSMTIDEACAKLSTATDLDSLKVVYTELPQSLQKDNEVIAKKDELKNQLTV
jgi:hypothetical protein